MDLWLLGVDGGGTRTTAVVGDAAGEVWGAGEAGPSNHHNVGLARAARAVETAVRRALRAAERRWRRLRAGAPLPPVAAAALGLAGLDAGRDLERWSAALSGRLPAARLRLMHDGEIALRAAFPRGSGLLVIAGTGSVVLATDGRRQVRVGGWGRWLGDQGSAWEVGLAGLRAAVAAHDGWGEPTELVERLRAAWPAGDPRELVAEGLEGPRAMRRIAAFAAEVTAAAAAGDAVAARILDAAAAALAAQAAAARRRLGAPVTAAALTGGMFRAAAYRERVAAALRRALPGVEAAPAAAPPVLGALAAAAADAGVAPPAALRVPAEFAARLKN
ncbi:MAG: BadF/BadG/BcrA/BcrD type ATPase [Firmicutes bacterium]|nr:BadF/BadG/BcrA/BcrD type ATPase [Bacillota bacterium]